MIFHDVRQGSEAWQKLRCGIPTASSFDRIITPKTRKPSAGMKAYAMELCAERLMGYPLEPVTTALMERGISLEERAVQSYAFSRDVEPVRVGFVTNDEGTVGVSPDRLIGEDGLLEAKAPAPSTHVKYLLGGLDDDYRCQLQGQLWIMERQWVDIVSHCPGLPDAIVHVERDEEFIAALAAAVNELLMLVDVYMTKLANAGWEPKPKEVPQDWLGVTDADIEALLQGVR